MGAVLRVLLQISVLAFSVSTMLSVGLGHTLRHVLGPMRDPRGVVRALLANFVLVPLLTAGVVRLVPLSPSHETGLMLVACAAGAPFLIRLTLAAGGSVPLSASLTMLLLPATVLFLPFALPLLEPQARVSAAAIGMPLLLTMILPMAVGLLVRARAPAAARWLLPWGRRLSSVALWTLVASTLAANFPLFVRFVAGGAFVAPVLMILGAFVIGYSLGREGRGGHVVLGLGTAQRNIAAAMVVAIKVLGDSDAVVMAVFTSLVDLALLFPIAWALKRRSVRTGRLVRA